MFTLGVIDLLTSREQAILIWVTVFLVWAFRKTGVPSSLGGLVRALVAPKILALYISAALYIAAVVAAGRKFELWHASALKETLYWFFGTGVILAANAAIGATEPAHLWKVVRQALRLTILLEFIVNFYVFPLVIELVVVPVILLLVVFEVVAATDPKFAQAQKHAKSALSVFGIFLLLAATVQAIGDFDALFNRQNAEDLLIPPALTIAFLPFLYAVALLCAYEMLFVHVEISLRPRPHLIRSTKNAILRACGLRLRRVGLFHRAYAIELRGVQDEDDVGLIVERFKRPSPAASHSLGTRADRGRSRSRRAA